MYGLSLDCRRFRDDEVGLCWGPGREASKLGHGCLGRDDHFLVSCLMVPAIDGVSCYNYVLVSSTAVLQSTFINRVTIKTAAASGDIVLCLLFTLSIKMVNRRL